MSPAEIAQLKGAVNAGRTIVYQRNDVRDLRRITGFHRDESTGEEYAIYDRQGTVHLGNNGAYVFLELKPLFPSAS